MNGEGQIKESSEIGSLEEHVEDMQTIDSSVFHAILEQNSKLMEMLTTKPSYNVMPDLNKSIGDYDGVGDSGKARLWLDRITGMMKLHSWPEAFALETARMHLVGAAKSWYVTYEEEFTSWREFKSIVTKMCRFGHTKSAILLLFYLLSMIIAASAHDQHNTDDNEIAEDLKQGPERQGKIGLPTGLLTNIAQDLLTRSTSSSQVLSLNLTNLVILLVLKAIIFGASTFGFGHQGRSVETETGKPASETFVSENELLLAMSYLKSDMTQKYGCLHRVACDNPTKAKEYLQAANVVFNGVSLFSKSAAESRYGQVISDLKEAVSYGAKTQDCSIRYTCDRW